MLDVQKEIILASMLRAPVSEESAGDDFFAGYDSSHTPYLLLPTAKGLLHDGALFTIPFQGKPDNSYTFTLTNIVQPRNLNDFALFHDQLEFFFGPEKNMLSSFLSSGAYQSYVNWTQTMVHQLIQRTLEQYTGTNDETEREKCREQLTLLLNE